MFTIDDDDLSSCVGCGLCLPHCPTYRLSGDESRSPRGRIALMALASRDGRWPDEDETAALDGCIQCRACEPACPSGVPYGRMIESARHQMVNRRRGRLRRLILGVLRRHRLLVASTPLVRAAITLRLVPRRLRTAGVPWWSGRAVRSTAERAPDVWLFTGCVMDAWQRDVHRAAARLIDTTGHTLRTPLRGGECCGALHSHAGLHETAAIWATRTIRSMPGDAPILVDSAGCGAALKEYGSLLGTEEAHRFSARVLDVHQWLESRLDVENAPTDGPDVIVQDPCHLRHVQRAAEPVHRLLGRVARVRGIADDGLCCGAGGSYSVTHPREATALRTAKVDRILALADGRSVVVASANPGCSMHLASDRRLARAGIEVRHPVQILVDRIATSNETTNDRGAQIPGTSSEETR